MMLYPEEHFWTVPTIPGLYDDNDYSGKVSSHLSTHCRSWQFAKKISFMCRKQGDEPKLYAWQIDRTYFYFYGKFNFS